MTIKLNELIITIQNWIEWYLYNTLINSTVSCVCEQSVFCSPLPIVVSPSVVWIRVPVIPPIPVVPIIGKKISGAA